MLISESALGKAEIKIQDSKITDNRSRFLAAAYSGYESDIQIKKTTVTGNQVTSLFNSGASNPEGSANSIIDVTESSINENIIESHGLVATGNAGSINIDNTTLCRNSTGYDGDDHMSYHLIRTSNVNLNVTDATICDNQLSAIRAASDEATSSVNISNSKISNNNSTSVGAAISVSSAHKAIINLNINETTIDGNSSLYEGGGIDIGAYDHAEINLDIYNSTLSNNGSSTLDDSIGAIYGVTINNSSLNIDIAHSTITENKSGTAGGGINIPDPDSLITVNIENSIIANNTAAYGSDQDLNGEFNVTNSLIKDTSTQNGTTINDTTIDQIGDGEGQTPDTGNNILGQDPLLQDLALSGGTWVHQLSAGSPAIAAGDALTENLPEYDQRGEGFARVRTTDSGSELDLGAVQYFSNPVAVNDELSVSSNSENNFIDVVANDAQNSDGLALDAGSITIMTHPENGTAEAQQDGTISYTPNAGYAGEDSLIYMLQDIAGNSSTEATVTITVSENSADSGGPLQLWILSLLAAFGLRRKFN